MDHHHHPRPPGRPHCVRACLVGHHHHHHPWSNEMKATPKAAATGTDVTSSWTSPTPGSAPIASITYTWNDNGVLTPAQVLPATATTGPSFVASGGTPDADDQVSFSVFATDINGLVGPTVTSNVVIIPTPPPVPPGAPGAVAATLVNPS